MRLSLLVRRFVDSLVLTRLAACRPAGAGAFEVACAADLKSYMREVQGRQKLGITRRNHRFFISDF